MNYRRWPHEFAVPAAAARTNLPIPVHLAIPVAAAAYYRVCPSVCPWSECPLMDVAALALTGESNSTAEAAAATPPAVTRRMMR
jgi:hypothetical protein